MMCLWGGVNNGAWVRLENQYYTTAWYVDYSSGPYCLDLFSLTAGIIDQTNKDVYVEADGVRVVSQRLNYTLAGGGNPSVAVGLVWVGGNETQGQHPAVFAKKSIRVGCDQGGRFNWQIQPIQWGHTV